MVSRAAKPVQGGIADWTPIVPVPDDAPRATPRHRHGKPSRTFGYKDAQGRPLFLVARFDLPDGGKDVLPLTWCEGPRGEQEWRWQGLPAPRPIYRLDELTARPSVPVLIVEGEKSADAAAAIFPDHATTTSPNGARAAGKADWSALVGRRVVVWGDNDVEGRAYAGEVASLVLSAGAASVGIVPVPTDFPDGWDVADEPPPEWDLPRLRGLLERAVPASGEQSAADPAHAPHTICAPPGFRMTDTGLYWVPDDPEKPPQLVAGPFQVLAETRDDRGGAWGVLIEWTDHDGRQHQWAVPRSLLAGDACEIRARLLDRGLYVSPTHTGRNRLTEYLIAVQSENRARCVDVTGWHGAAYVMPGTVYGDSAGERVILQTAGAVADFDCLGSFEGWREEIAALAVGNSRLALALSAAFAGPLLYLVGEEAHGFHFSGGSSSGKTTALRVAGSVWGVPINTWRTTDNAAEGLARAANDGLLLLDELSQVDGRAADALAYMLGNGQGKARARRDATAKPVATWRLVFLSTGEVGLADKIGEAGKRAKAGQSVRLIEIPADAGAGHKMFQNLHGFAGGDALSRHLRAASEKHRGHAIRLALEIIARDPAGIADAINAELAEWMDQHLPQGADGQVSRVAARFALAAAAGQMATDWGILPWPDGEAARAAATCFAAWQHQRGGIGSAESAAGLAQVIAFIEAHGTSRFSPIGDDAHGDDARTINRAGWRRKDDLDRWEYLALPQAWATEICRGADARAIARDLVARGFLVPGRDGKISKTERIPRHGKPRVYHLTADILAGGRAE